MALICTNGHLAHSSECKHLSCLHLQISLQGHQAVHSNCSTQTSDLAFYLGKGALYFTYFEFHCVLCGVFYSVCVCITRLLFEEKKANKNKQICGHETPSHCMVLGNQDIVPVGQFHIIYHMSHFV